MRNFRRALAPCLLVLAACGNTLPTYRCVNAIDGSNENGGEVASLGTIAYVAGFTTISVFDLADPGAPKTLTPLAFPQRVEAIAVGGTRLVAAGSQVLQVFDLADPKAPAFVGQVNTGATAHNALATDGHWAYAGTPNGTVTVFDVSGAAPVLITQAASGGALEITDLLLHGDVLYAGNGVGHSLVAYDVSRRDQPVPQPAVEANGKVLGLAFDNGSLFASTSFPTAGAKAQRYDVSAPLAPVLAETAGGGCACSAGNVTAQVATAHGFFLAPLEYGRVVGAYREASLSTAVPDEVGVSCIPDRTPITNVHAVGEALIITGGSSIGFLAP